MTALLCFTYATGADAISVVLMQGVVPRLHPTMNEILQRRSMIEPNNMRYMPGCDNGGRLAGSAELNRVQAGPTAAWLLSNSAAVNSPANDKIVGLVPEGRVVEPICTQTHKPSTALMTQCHVSCTVVAAHSLLSNSSLRLC